MRRDHRNQRVHRGEVAGMNGRGVDLCEWAGCREEAVAWMNQAKLCGTHARRALEGARLVRDLVEFALENAGSDVG